jgi:hypothetical protein
LPAALLARPGGAAAGLPADRSFGDVHPLATEGPYRRRPCERASTNPGTRASGTALSRYWLWNGARDQLRSGRSAAAQPLLGATPSSRTRDVATVRAARRRCSAAGAPILDERSSTSITRLTNAPDRY